MTGLPVRPTPRHRKIKIVEYSILGDVEIQHYREEGDEGWDGPDYQEEDGHRPEAEADDDEQAAPLPGLPPCDPVCVLQWVLDPDVSVQSYHAEAQDGGRGAHHVTAEINLLDWQTDWRLQEGEFHICSMFHWRKGWWIKPLMISSPKINSSLLRILLIENGKYFFFSIFKPSRGQWPQFLIARQV